MDSLLIELEQHAGDSIAVVTPQGELSRLELLEGARRLRRDTASDAIPSVGREAEIARTLESFVAFDGYLRAFVLAPHDSQEPVIATASSCNLQRTQQATRWILATSGTTGTPKLVSHTLRSLTRTVKTDVDVGATLRWALLYDPCRFAGLQVTLQALLGGSTLLAPPRDNIDACVDFLIDQGCTSLSATPSMARKLLTAARVDTLRPRHLTLGGEIADDKLLTALTRLFPDAKITHIYASTEAGVGFSVRDGKAGFPASYLHENTDEAVQLRIDQQSILRIRGGQRDQEYIGVNAELFDDEGYVDTGDLVEVRGDRVHFLGRANGSINVGGLKVLPEEVEQVIRACRGVLDVVVYGKKSPMVGNLVCADVVVAGGNEPAAIEREIVASCKSSLDVFKRPAIIKFVPSIAISCAGKIQRGASPWRSVSSSS